MFRRLLARLTKRSAPSDAEIAKEMRDHLELEAESIGASHAGAGDPSAAARRRFGNVTATSEGVRDVWRWTWLDDLAQDTRHGIRALARSPAYSVAVIVTLAMGIAAGAATYSLSRAIHNPFPLLPQHKLLWITQTSAACAPDCTEVSPAGLAALRTRAPSIVPIGVAGWTPTLRTSEGTTLLSGYRLSANAFEVLEAPFAAGRGFPNDAGDAGGPRFVVLSYDFWRRQFDGRRSLIDSVITLGGDPYRVTGVLADGVVFPMAADVYAPYASRASESSNYVSRNYHVFARLAAGATLATAAAETRTIGAQLGRESPATDSGWVLRARPIADFHTDDVAILEQISAIAALLVFLAACMSAANLALSRLAARRHELALRTALGVRRWRLARHLLTEALLLSVVASMLGALLARWAVHAIRDAIPQSFAAFLPGWSRLGLDAGALAFALGAAALAVVISGALPVLRATRVNLTSVLSDGGRASTGGAHSARTRATLIVLEVSTTLILLTGATLLVRSVRNMVRGDAGVRIDHTLVMPLTLPPRFTDSAAVEFYRRLDGQFRSVPGIRAAGIGTASPLSNDWSGDSFQIPGREPAPKGHDLRAIDQHVTPAYAEASGFHIVSGRMIGAQDAPGAQHALVVNQFMADAFWPGESAIGRLVTIDSASWTIVGVASNVHHGGLDEPMRYTIYRSILQSPVLYSVIAVWTAGDPQLMRDVVRRAVARTDPSAAVGETMTMEQMRARHVSAFALMAGMLGVLAAVTLTIAVVGLYGLIAYGVAQRTREIGVRMALGARPRDIVARVATGAVRLTAIALVFGVAGAALFARVLAAMLYDITPSDPRTYIEVSVSLLVVALIAALLPSWRAARVDPTIALRD
jgi:putative ABC transport system permease protein